MIAALFVCLPVVVNGQPKGIVAKSDVLQAFDFGQVQLLPGLMHEQFVEIKNYYMAIPSDDMLYEFRLSVGETHPPGHRLGGWYKELQGLTLSQWISAFSRLYAITGDPTCKDKAAYLVDEWWKCFTKGVALKLTGCAVNKNNANNDKWVHSLLDFYKYCGRADALDKLDVLIKWAEDSMERTRLLGHNSLEWYTAADPLYQAYVLTGKKEYKNFAGFWEYTEYWNQFATKPINPFAKAPIAGMNREYCHAYSHINSFNSAAEAYRVKGDARYLDAMKNAYDWMQTEQMFATGGYGPFLEHLMPIDKVAKSLTTRTDHCETQCDSWAALCLSQNLITLTGEARYGNWIERLAYNAINATIPMTPGGNVVYYSNYNIHGAVKLNRPIEWTCCAGTRPLTVIQYFINTYYHDEKNIYVNLFTPSTVTWKRNPHAVKLTQQTASPYSDTTEFFIATEKPGTFGLALRVPEWVAGTMTAMVNGQKVEGVLERGWFVVHRQWNDGDKLRVTMPMDFWLSVLDKNKGGPTAVMYGPLAMAFTTPDKTLLNSIGTNKWWTYKGILPENPDQARLDSIDLKNIKNLVTPVNDKLEFALNADHSVRLKPFMNYRENELYYLYLATKQP